MEGNAATRVGVPVWIVKFLATVVTANVCLVVAGHWRSYDVLGKFLAVLLSAYLVVIPVVATWGRKDTRRIEWGSLLPAYMMLMLATALFGTR